LFHQFIIFTGEGEGAKEDIPQVKTIEVLRAEPIDAVATLKGETLQFPLDSIQVEFHVGVTQSAFLSSRDAL
jgi:hypothetical protein